MPTELDWQHQLATLSDAVYDPEKTTIGNWTRLTDGEVDTAGIDPSSLINKKSGLKSGIYKNSKDDIVLAYAGTEMPGSWLSKEKWADVATNAKQALGFETDQYRQASELADLAVEAFSDKLSFTGHSLGAALATLAAAKTGRPATVFNPAGVHNNTLKRNDVNPQAFKKLANAGLVKSVVVKGEILDKVQGLEMTKTTAAATSGLLASGNPISMLIGAVTATAVTRPSAAGERIEIEHPGSPNTLDKHKMGKVLEALNFVMGPTAQRGQKHDLEFSIQLAGQAPNSLRLTSFKWQESLSECDNGVATVASRNANIDLNQCIDQAVTLEIRHKYDPEIRYLHGIVKSMSAQDVSGGWAYYRLKICPELYRLTLTSDARIFQQETVPDIVAKILKDQGIVQHEFRLNDSHIAREYCVQYQESDFNFINRLLAEEGIFYFWEHTQAGSKLILTDHSQLGTRLESSDIKYNNTPSGAVKTQFIRQFSWQEAVGSTDLKQRDYCFTNPRYNQEHTLVQQRRGGEPDVYSLYNPYGRYKEGDSGKRFTQYQLESARNKVSLGLARSNAQHLSAGHHFSLTDHPSNARNLDYQVIHIQHEGEQPQALEEQGGQGRTEYTNKFSVYALDTNSWRADAPKKPRMDGPQVAHVVGPKGEEIYCDEHGRVKVQFPWDLQGENNEHSSCWIRVSQGWAGTAWGSMSIPRVGQEVIVDFLEGDPDQPVITGRTYHSVNVPPYELPAHKTRMTIRSKTHKGDGFNELRFEDEKGKEEVFIQAEKDYKRLIKNNEESEVQADLKVVVAKSSQKSAKSALMEAADFIEFKVGNSSIKITPNGIEMSATKVDVKGSAIVDIKGGLTKIN
ncbi:MAG: type VI secretion system tip protein VgrG [Thiomicrorhabdus sp.]|nr:type VI secretion system tip protein VgrG [Thiomicrorhabdus sp.]